MILPERLERRLASRAATTCRLPPQRWCLEAAVRTSRRWHASPRWSLPLSLVRAPNRCSTDSQGFSTSGGQLRPTEVSGYASDELAPPSTTSRRSEDSECHGHAELA